MHLPWKALASAIAAVCWRVSVTSPNPPPTSKDKIYRENFFERVLAGLTAMNKTYTFTVLMAEAALYLAASYPSLLPSSILSIISSPGLSNSDVLDTISPLFVVGFIIVLLGTALRVWCYQTLGRHFTFEVTLLDDHKLVTDGPYAFVRHPGYVAFTLVLVGVGAMISSPYAWLRGHGVGAAVELWFCMMVWVTYNLLSRMRVEDSSLKSRFGQTWEDYAKDVPFQLIPGLY